MKIIKNVSTKGTAMLNMVHQQSESRAISLL